jgi:hypothetical protein
MMRAFHFLSGITFHNFPIKIPQRFEAWALKQFWGGRGG